MKLLTNIKRQPFIQTNFGVINLNSLQVSNETTLFPVKTGKELKISKHKNNKFLEKAGKYFKISRISKTYGITWYKLESQFVIFCVIQGNNLQLIGNYPVFYLKLLYRYVNSL